MKNRHILPSVAIIMSGLFCQNAIASDANTRTARVTNTTYSNTAHVSALEVARRDPSLSIMVEAIEASGLSSVLRFAGDDYTIFAPNNQAFNRLFAQTTLTKESLFANKEAVRVLLAYHIIKDNEPLYTRNLTPGRYTTYSNRAITVTTQGNIVDSKGRTAHITRPNITTNNGVMHVIDSVMFPTR